MAEDLAGAAHLAGALAKRGMRAVRLIGYDAVPEGPDAVARADRGP